SERVAGRGPAVVEADDEPVLALRGRAVGPGLGPDAAGGAALLEVVADDRRGVQRLLDRLIGDLAALVAGVLPDPGPAVGLQLEATRARVAARRIVVFGRRDAMGDAEQQLHVMAHLMADHVGLREVAKPDSDLTRERVEEARVQVHAVVGAAVEGPDL